MQSHAYQTYVSLDKLSCVLDYILYGSSEKFVTPKDELEFTVNLIEINKIKMNPLFDFRLKQNVDRESPAYKEKILAPLLTVDFIENSFRHTNFLADNAFIYVELNFRNQILEIKVQNLISDRAPMQKKNAGFGGSSLEQWLKMLYKKDYKLSRHASESTYTAYLKIDLNDF